MKGQFFRRMLTSFAIIGMILVGRIDDASAGMITIKNHSFEDEVLAAGVGVSHVESWTQGWSADGFGIGTWNALDLSMPGGFFVKETLDGDQHVYLNGGSIAQQLETNLVLGETYRLSALFGNGTDPAWASGGSLELWAGGTVADGEVIGGFKLGELVVLDAALENANGKFAEFSTYIVAPTFAPLGEHRLSIRFKSSYLAIDGEHRRESEIDNIQLSTVSAVPEPTSFALLGLGGCVLTISARRRKRSAAA